MLMQASSTLNKLSYLERDSRRKSEAGESYGELRISLERTS